MASDDIAGEILRDPRDELKSLFCEAYRAWIREMRLVERYLLQSPRMSIPVGTFAPLDKAWGVYVKIRDEWERFRW